MVQKKNLDEKTKIRNSLMLKGTVGLLQVHIISAIFTKGTQLTHD